MRRILLFMILTVVTALPAAVSAQQKYGSERAQWMNEMRQYKRSYFVKELDLSREQQNKFFPLYEEMEDKTMKIEDEARTMERRIADTPDATDTEYEKGAEALYDARVESAQTEKEYMEKFKTILTRKQLFRLKGVERQFARDMMKQHHRLRSTKKSK